MIQSNSSHKARYFFYIIDTVSVKIHSVTNDGRTEEGLKQENIFYTKQAMSCIRKITFGKFWGSTLPLRT